MKAIKATGLVPVRGLVHTQFKAGTVFGLAPDKAIRALKDKEVELAPIPAGIETIEIGFDAPEPAPEVAGIPDDAVEIPDNWDKPFGDGGLQWMQLVKIAQTITGAKLVVPDGAKAVDVAKDVIRTEIERRAAASTPPQPAAAA